MRYRTKLYISLAGTALVSSLLGFGILMYEFRDHTFSDEQSRVLTVTSTAAALIDPELLGSVRSAADLNTPAYQTLKAELMKVRNANRRSDIFIEYLYTIVPSRTDPNQMVYGVDAEENPSLESMPGSPFESTDAQLLIKHHNEYFSPAKLESDPYGVWITGYAPVFDKAGNYVGTIGADISVESYLVLIKEVFQLFSLAFLASLIFAFVGGHLLARRFSTSLHTILLCVNEIGSGNLNAQATLKTHDEFEELAEEINKMAQGLKERERLKLNFARYVSEHIMEKILKSESPTKLEGERRKITVLFSDIRQFTKLAETLPPERVVSLLNEYFGVMIDVIFRYQGTLDKFLGDGIMVEFGAPLDDDVQEKHAVMAAVGMQMALKDLSKKWEAEGKPKFEIGIGVHTGLAVVGNIGSEKRIEYTAIGDTVNIAARLEQATKLLKKSILVSEMTYNAVKDEFKATSLGPMILPGRKEPITIYSIDLEG